MICCGPSGLRAPSVIPARPSSPSCRNSPTISPTFWRCSRRPGLGVADVARGFGCRAVDVETAEELEQELKTALSADTTTVIVVRTQPEQAML
jgi:hypothetical protein